MAGKRDKLHRWLAQGGQRALRSGATGEVFERHGDKLERQSPAGEATKVSNLLDPRLKISDRQRATGNCYGHHAEKVTTSGATEFIREYVDRSITGTGGATERHLQMMMMVDAARKAVGAMPAITYPLRARGPGQVGDHRKVKPVVLLDAICLFGWKLETVAVFHGWTVHRQGGAKVGQEVVPDRQRKHLAEALRCVLDEVYDAWDARGYAVPFEFGQIVVR